MSVNRINELKIKLEKEKLDIDSLIVLACQLDRVYIANKLDNIIAQFHIQAELYPYVDDEDVGAVILQYYAFCTKDINLRKRLLTEAIRRAERCAQCASSGGEGKARSEHFLELLHQLKRYQGCASCRIHAGKFKTEIECIAAEKKVSDLIKTGELKKIPDKYTKAYFFEKLYQCLLCQQVWRFSYPDQAYRGGWIPSEESIKVNN